MAVQLAEKVTERADGAEVERVVPRVNRRASMLRIRSNVVVVVILIIDFFFIAAAIAMPVRRTTALVPALASTTARLSRFC